MICDLLSQAGISARVDGEFLQSARWRMPLGNAVKVRVDPARAAEAREVIAEWEKIAARRSDRRSGDNDLALQVAAVVPRRARRWAWSLPSSGSCTGGSMAVASTTTAMDATKSQYYYKGDDCRAWTTHDRNDDGKVDARWNFDVKGYRAYEADDDFDGRFEWQLRRRRSARSVAHVLDADGDGRPEQVWHFVNGVL